jgi:hypothetical protein
MVLMDHILGVGNFGLRAFTQQEVIYVKWDVKWVNLRFIIFCAIIGFKQKNEDMERKDKPRMGQIVKSRADLD